MNKGQQLHLTIWMNTPSFYQIDLFRELAAMEYLDLKVVFVYDVPSDRQKLGWRTEIDDHLDVYFLNQSAPVSDAIRLAWQQRDRIHIVNGIWAEPPFTAAICLLRLVCPHYFIYAEAPNPFYKRSYLKKLVRKILGQLLAKTSRAALLAVASFSSKFYQDYGFSPERIYSFGYFRDQVELDQPVTQKTSTSIIFVGQLIPRKRVDLLLDAAAPLLNESTMIEIVGDGEERPNLEAKALQLNISDYVRFYGAIPSDEVMRHVAGASVLVLPSDHDGWGLVVNEALMVGVPLIVSDGCGAADIVAHGQNGFVFKRNDLFSLRQSLEAFLSADQNKLRENALMSGQQLSAKVASRYLVACIRHKLNLEFTKPSPPWLKVPDDVSVMDQVQ